MFHTFFGIAALSLLPFNRSDIIQYIEPTYALPYGILMNDDSFSHIRTTLVKLEKGRNVWSITQIYWIVEYNILEY